MWQQGWKNERGGEIVDMRGRGKVCCEGRSSLLCFIMRCRVWVVFFLFKAIITLMCRYRKYFFN